MPWRRQHQEDADSVYGVVAGGRTELKRLSLAGSATTVAKDVGSAFAIDATHIYFSQDDKLKRIPKAGGDSETLVHRLDGPATSIAVGDNTVYFIVNAQRLYRTRALPPDSTALTAGSTTH